MTKEEFLTIRIKYIGTQDRCSNLIGMSKRAVMRYEKGESDIPPPVATIMRLVEDDPVMIDDIETLSKLD